MPLQDDLEHRRKPRWWLLAAALSGAIAWRALAGFHVMAVSVGNPENGDHPLPLFLAHVLEGILAGTALGLLLAYAFAVRPRPSPIEES